MPFALGDWVLVDFGGNVRHYDVNDNHIEDLYPGGLGGYAVRGAVFDNNRNLYLAFDGNRIDKWLADGSGPFVIYDITMPPNWGPRTLETDGVSLYFSTINSNIDPRIVRLNLDGSNPQELVTILDQGIITYDDNPHFGLSADRSKLYGQYGKLDGATRYTSVWETLISTNTPTLVFEELAPSSSGIIGDFDDIVPLPDGSFAVMTITGATNPIIKKYDSSWVFVEDMIAEVGSDIVVNGVTHAPPSGFYVLDEDVMLTLGPTRSTLLFAVPNPSAGTVEVWEYDLVSKLITAKHVALNANSAVRSFAFVAPAVQLLPVVTVIGAN